MYALEHRDSFVTNAAGGRLRSSPAARNRCARASD